MPRSLQQSGLFRLCLSVLLTLVLPILTFTGCASAGRAEPDTIRIGLIVPKSSAEMAILAQAMENGAAMAVDQVNDAGGLEIGGQRYRLMVIVEDDRNAPDQAIEAVRRLVFQHDVQAIVGPGTSRSALAAATIAETARVPMISPTATHPDLTAGREFVFRVAFNDEFQGQVMAEFATNSLHAQRAAVLYDTTNSYNRSIAEIFRTVFEANGGHIVAFESYLVGEDNFRPQLIQIQSGEPDLIFLPNFVTDVLLQAQQIKELGLTAALLGSDSWDWQQLVSEPALNGAYFSNHFNPGQDNPGSQLFVTEYEQRYSILPTGGAALTYDAFQLLFTAMRNQGAVDSEAIQRGLSTVTELNGVTGMMRYIDGHRDPLRSAVILRLLDQQAHFYELVDP